MSGVAFVDIETTGLDPINNPIWEIAVILPDGPSYCWQVEIPDGLPVVADGDVPPDGPWISQWSARDLDRRYSPEWARTREWSAIQVAELLAGRHIVGAVPSFDEERLRLLLRAYNLEPTWHYHLIDIEAMMVGVLASRGETIELPWKSHELSERLGIEPTPDAELHTALGDARWAQRVFESIMGAGS